MTVTINGSSIEVDNDAALSDAIAMVGTDPDRRGIAVAVNGVVVPRAEWSTTRLSHGDKVEVLTAVAGG